jgi:hypothetical protein
VRLAARTSADKLDFADIFAAAAYENRRYVTV